MAQRDIQATMALVYANGSLHLGHMVEAIQADIWVRFQRLRGHRCLFIGGNDAHGTPIMLSAQKQGITPEALIEAIHAEHKASLEAFAISFDSFHTTHSEENQQLTESIYQRLCDNDDIEVRTISQAFDPKEGMFLPDRFIKGSCPRCKAEDQYGDSCEACGATYDPTELIDARSVLSGETPIEKDSEHYFFKLDKYSEFLAEWTQQGHLQPQIANKLQEWFDAGLQQWDISRDAPYFGFNIPGQTDKFFYVWLDAPIGYIAALKKLMQERPELNLEHYWQEGSDTELYHFIGKDIVYFHALFWPAILKSSGHRTPTALCVHGFLTINGEKMSKSRGTFITADHYLEHLNPEYLRYYFAAKLNHQVEDIDLNLQDFKLRVNSDLVGKVVNIASRCAGFIRKKFDNQLASHLPNPDLQQSLTAASETIAHAYEARNQAKAVREIMALADLVNQYIDQEKPWVLAKDESTLASVQGICTQGINAFRLLMIYLKPILPMMAEKAEAFLNVAPLTWQDLQTPLLDHTLNRFEPLMSRIEDEALEALVKKDEPN
jgi:methionyl-tRNA synthetase